jgi:LPS O-antigen subunit length determinant protein (WzzB/FepE family)
MQSAEQINDEISLKELIQKIGDWWRYLLSKWLVIIICAMVGGGIGLLYAFVKKPEYKAVVTFALEDDKQGGGGLSGALGLASSLGIDLGTSAGGAFSGANLIELMKSRKMVLKTLLSSCFVNNSQTVLANQLLALTKLDKTLANKSAIYQNFSFPLNAKQEYFSIQQDSVLFLLYDKLFEDKILSVSQKDKKVSIITVEVNATNELFSKAFAENLVTNVSEFYVETKSKKAKNNVAILQRQADSIRNELNMAITGVATSTDNTFNLNPALNVNRIPSTKKQIDVQANTAILTQLVTNLEMAKVTLLRETPLIQLIDRPTLPLKKDKPSKSKSLMMGGFLAGFLTVLYLIVRKMLKQVMQ